MKITPSIQMVLEDYPKIAAVERIRMERPCEKTVIGAICNIRRLCEIGGISHDEPITVFTRKKLQRILDAARSSSLKPITICSYLHSLKTVFAKWSHPYYADKKWNIPKIELPPCRRAAPRYVRPDSTILARVKEWYISLEKRPDAREWVLATLMLEFAMRNGDVERLRWSDFRKKDSGFVLGYTPNKTRFSSGRFVAWPVHPVIWKRLSEYHAAGIPYNKRKGWRKNAIRDSQLVVPCARDVYVRLNKELRMLKIFNGPKACYELRKICIVDCRSKWAGATEKPARLVVQT